MSNMRFNDRSAFFKHAAKLGETEAAGALSASQFLVDLSIATLEGHVSATSDDAKEAWAAYRSKQKSKLGAAVTDPYTEANFKQRASACKKVIEAAIMPGVNFHRTLEAARPIIIAEKEAGNTKMNTFDSFVAIARAQCDVEGRDLTEAELKQALLPKEKTEKERNEITSLEAIIKQLKVHQEGTEPSDKGPGKEAFPSDAAATAMQLLQDRITILQLTAMQTKAATINPFPKLPVH